MRRLIFLWVLLALVGSLPAAAVLPDRDEPVRTIVPNLVYAGTGREVRTVMVDGQILMRDYPPILVHGLDEQIGDRSLVETVSTVGGYRTQRPGEILLDPFLSGFISRTVRLVEDRI